MCFEVGFLLLTSLSLSSLLTSFCCGLVSRTFFAHRTNVSVWILYKRFNCRIYNTTGLSSLMLESKLFLQPQPSVLLGIQHTNNSESNKRDWKKTKSTQHLLCKIRLLFFYCWAAASKTHPHAVAGQHCSSIHARTAGWPPAASSWRKSLVANVHCFR